MTSPTTPRASRRGNPSARRCRLASAAGTLACLALGLAAPLPAAAVEAPPARGAAAGSAGAAGDGAILTGLLSSADRSPAGTTPSTPSASPGRTAVRYAWPTGHQVLVARRFDPPAVVWGSGHRGVDLAWPAGTQVLAAADGRVAFAGTVAGRPTVSIDHADGIRTTYEPVEPLVRAGQQVRRGQAIGTLRPGHRSDGVDALHWGARRGRETYVDPLRLLSPAVIRLKPVGAQG